MYCFSFWWKVPKGYMTLKLIFVSARTIKRHHHQGGHRQCRIAATRHTVVAGHAGPLRRRRPPRCCSPTRHIPRQQQQSWGNEDILLSATGPSTVWCSKVYTKMSLSSHHASASARSPSWPPMPRPRLQRAATAQREKVQISIREQIFFNFFSPHLFIKSIVNLR